MLVLTRKIGETIVINGNIEVTILATQSNQVRVGVEAPKEISVHREEVYERIQTESQSTEDVQNENIGRE